MGAAGALGWLRALSYGDWAQGCIQLSNHRAGPDVTPVLLAQPPWEPGHGAGGAACSPGVGEEGLPLPTLPTLVSCDATTCPRAAPSPSPPDGAPSLGGDNWN